MKVLKYEHRIFEQSIKNQPPTFVTILPVTRNGHKLGQVLISYVLFKMRTASGDSNFGSVDVSRYPNMSTIH